MLKEKLSSACEANPKEDSCSQPGGEDVTGVHRPDPGNPDPRRGDLDLMQKHWMSESINSRKAIPR